MDKPLPHRNIGKFSVAWEVIDRWPEDVIKGLEGVLILRAESIHHRQAIEYVGIHPDFEPVPIGNEPAVYQAILKKNEAGVVTREKWERVPVQS